MKKVPAVLVAVLGLASSLLAATTAAGEAFSVPISNHLVEGEVALQNGETIRFKVLEGAMLTIEDSEEGTFLGLTPTISNRDDLQVRFKVFEITRHPGGLESLRELAAIDVVHGRAGSFTGPGYLEVKATAISTSDLSEEGLQAFRGQLFDRAAQDDRQPGTRANSCCVTCGSTTSCACAVEMSCGSCCTDPCCGGGGGGKPPLQDH